MMTAHSPNSKLRQVALRVARLLAARPNLRQTEIARALGEHDSTIMRALPVAEELGIRLTEDAAGRLALAED
jgi:DNA-binding IclR family transcriptional regulator